MNSLPEATASATLLTGKTSPSHAGQRAPRTATLIAAASAGNALEFFDFTVYGYFAIQIGDAFFPAHSHEASLLQSWAVFASSFLARPIGALVLGSYADRRGRKQAMTLSIALMTLGTLFMACMPSYSAIGPIASLGIIAGRLLQGFSAGGEFGGSTVFLLEYGGARRALFASFQFMSQSVSTLLGAFSAWAASAMLTPASLHDWGFRLPFLFGLLIGPVGWYVRRHLEETPVFIRHGPGKAPALDAIRRHPGRLALGAGTIAAGTATTYMAIYLPTFAQHDLHMAPRLSYAIPLVTSAIGIIVTPLAAAFSDRLGRITPALAGCVLLLLIAWPAFHLVTEAPQFRTMLAVMCGLAVLRSGYSAALPALLGEIFPPSVRAVGISTSYSVGVLLFGSALPLVSSAAIQATGNRTLPGAYLAVCALISASCLLGIARRIRLEHE